MTPEEIKIRAERSAQLLRDPMLVDALDGIKREVIEQWDATPARDVEAREFLWKFYKTSKKFRMTLQGAVDNGKVVILKESQKRSAPERVLNAINEFRRK